MAALAGAVNVEERASHPVIGDLGRPLKDAGRVAVGARRSGDIAQLIRLAVETVPEGCQVFRVAYAAATCGRQPGRRQCRIVNAMGRVAVRAYRTLLTCLPRQPMRALRFPLFE